MSLSSHPVGQMYTQMYSRYTTGGDIYRSSLASHAGSGFGLEWPCGDVTGNGGGVYGTMLSASSPLHARTTGGRIVAATPGDADNPHQSYDQQVRFESIPSDAQLLFSQQLYDDSSMKQSRSIKSDTFGANHLEQFNNNETGYPVCMPTLKTTESSRVCPPNQFSHRRDDLVAMATPSVECIDGDVNSMTSAAAVPEAARHYNAGVSLDESQRAGQSSSSPVASRKSPSVARTSTPLDPEQETKHVVADAGSDVLASRHGVSSDESGEHHCLLWACKTCKKKTTAAVDRRKVNALTYLLTYLFMLTYLHIFTILFASFRAFLNLKCRRRHT